MRCSLAHVATGPAQSPASPWFIASETLLWSLADAPSGAHTLLAASVAWVLVVVRSEIRGSRLPGERLLTGSPVVVAFIPFPDPARLSRNALLKRCFFNGGRVPTRVCGLGPVPGVPERAVGP